MIKEGGTSYIVLIFQFFCEDLFSWIVKSCFTSCLNKENCVWGFFNMLFHFRPLVPESVNNSLFHQLAEQLQQQNLEHLRQQLLEQQQPQKVRTPSCGCRNNYFLLWIKIRTPGTSLTLEVFITSWWSEFAE